MNWTSFLFFMTLAEAVLAYFIFQIYHQLPLFSDLTPKAMLRMLIYMVPVNLLILFLLEKFSSTFSGSLLRGRAGKNHHSQLSSMAMDGRREEACALLAKAASKGDPEALRRLVSIATQPPVLHVWMSKATVLRGKVKGMTREDHAALDAMLSRTRKQEKKEEFAAY